MLTLKGDIFYVIFFLNWHLLDRISLYAKLKCKELHHSQDWGFVSVGRWLAWNTLSSEFDPQELRGLLAHARNSSTHEAGGRGIRSPKAFEARL